jgi:TolB protein
MSRKVKKKNSIKQLLNTPTNLTNDILEDYSPSCSPDGKWIAYSSGTSKQYDVWVINLATKNKIRLTTEPKRNETPVW